MTRTAEEDGPMASTLCPYCSKYSHMSPKWGRISDSDSHLRLAATCDNCEGVLVAEGRGPYLSGGVIEESEEPRYVQRAVVALADELSWLPLAAEAPVIDDVPDAIARAAREAHAGLSIGNHMSAILMARTVIEATAKAKGITSGSLATKINALRDGQLIRPSIADQAHEVRFLGNDMAHGDIDDAPQYVDAEEVLALMGQVLNEVFQGPALMRRIRERRMGVTPDE
jgi:hypothetical protein